jgi:hypothetical protein
MWYLHDDAPPNYVQNGAQEIRENGDHSESSSAFLDTSMKLALQTMAGISSNFFDVSFYGCTYNYCLFTRTLLFKPVLFYE